MEALSHDHVLGREAELAEILRSIDATPAGARGLILEGSAGIGKTTLWQAGVEAASAAGFHVLVTRAAESEATLSYAALGDLFEHVGDEVRSQLPDPQSRALDAALLRSGADVSIPDRRAISLAALAVIRGLADREPVVIAIDDIQWLDTPSVGVLAFVLRRLRIEPVSVIASLRVGSEAPIARLELGRALGDDRVRRLPVGSLSEEVIGRLLRQRLGVEFGRTVIVRINAVSGGNPLFALEIARAMVEQDAIPVPGEPLPVPEDLRGLLAARISGLPPSAREPLLAMACLSQPTLDLVLAVADRPDVARQGLASAEAADVIVQGDGRLRFSHPLFGSTVVSATPQAEVRELHRTLAAHVADLEERARHLALASIDADPAVAGELDRAARHARARGAPDAAAELSVLALQRTPESDVAQRRQRQLDTAGYHFDAGDALRATELLSEAAASTPPGTMRAEILYRLSSMSWMNLQRGVRAPLMEALPQAVGDDALVAGIHLDLAWVDLYQADLANALAHGRASVEHARRTGDPATNGDALASLSMMQFLRGAPVSSAMSDAIELQDAAMAEASWTDASVYTTPRSILGLQLMWSGELDRARATLEHELSEYERLGMYTLRQEVLCYLAELECRAGRWTRAERFGADAAETVAESGMAASQLHVVRFNQALAAAYLGHVEDARRLATEGLRLARENDDAFNAAWNGSVLGFLALSLGDHGRAHDHLEPAVGWLDRLDAAEPGVIPCVPDDVEALIALGRTDAADAVLEPFARKARSKDRPWARAAALRCEGALAAARGDRVAALTALDAAAEQHARTSLPFETARTAMVRGVVERRGRQKRTARASLEEALDTFESLGAPLWAARARDELARAGGGRDATTTLTPTEERVARLVGEGKTNREVADALFVSVKTVEANLTRIFHKLGVRSRADLIRREAGATVEPDA